MPLNHPLEKMKKNSDPTQKERTLCEQVGEAVAIGYSKNFRVETHYMLAEGAAATYKPEQVKIANFYRFEGYNDPQDSSILYLIETEDGNKGTLVDAYGVYADEKISQFVRDIENIGKKMDS